MVMYDIYRPYPIIGEYLHYTSGRFEGIGRFEQKRLIVLYLTLI